MAGTEQVIKVKQPKREKWQDDIVPIRFLNLERKEDHSFTVNGVTFSLKHGGVHKVPRAVVEALNDAVSVRWRVNDIHVNKTPEKFMEPRFSAQIISEEQYAALMPTEKKQIIEEITAAQHGKATETQAELGG